MKKIPLTQGQVALVDDGDYEWLSQWKWYAKKGCSGIFYAVRNIPEEKESQRIVRMHRVILGLEPGDKRQGDHIDHNTLDNRRSNLRICTPQQNCMNQKPTRNSTSKFKGVCWSNWMKKWRATIQVKRKHKHLGYWDMEEVAALAYDMAATYEFGEFAYLNKTP